MGVCLFKSQTLLVLFDSLLTNLLFKNISPHQVDVDEKQRDKGIEAKGKVGDKRELLHIRSPLKHAEGGTQADFGEIHGRRQDTEKTHVFKRSCLSVGPVLFSNGNNNNDDYYDNNNNDNNNNKNKCDNNNDNHDNSNYDNSNYDKNNNDKNIIDDDDDNKQRQLMLKLLIHKALVVTQL